MKLGTLGGLDGPGPEGSIPSFTEQAQHDYMGIVTDHCDYHVLGGVGEGGSGDCLEECCQGAMVDCSRERLPHSFQ